MILWVDGEAAGAPVNQRAEVIEVHTKECLITVRLCGTGERKHLRFKDVRGVEISDEVSLKWKSAPGFSTTSIVKP